MSSTQMISFNNVQFFSLIVLNENFIKIQNIGTIDFDNCTFSQIYTKNTYFIYSFDSPLTFQNSQFYNNTIEN